MEASLSVVQEEHVGALVHSHVQVGPAISAEVSGQEGANSPKVFS
jgi:hypothetical protein